MEFYLNELNRTNWPGDWVKTILLIILVLYAIARLVYPRYWNSFGKAVLFSVEEDRLLFEQNINIERLAFLLNFLATISIATFLYLSINLFTSFLNPFPPYLAFLIVLVAFASFSGVKYVFTFLLGRLFSNPDMAVVVNHKWLILYKAFGFLILGWTFLLVFLPVDWRNTTASIGLILLAMMLIVSAIKVLMQLYQARISLLYGILYLCTLEFLPVLMIVRLVTS